MMLRGHWFEEVFDGEDGANVMNKLGNVNQNHASVLGHQGKYRKGHCKPSAGIL